MISVGTIAAFGVYRVRTSALVLATPLLGNGAAFSGYKVALVALVSFALFSATGAPLEGEPYSHMRHQPRTRAGKQRKLSQLSTLAHAAPPRLPNRKRQHY